MKKSQWFVIRLVCAKCCLYYFSRKIQQQRHPVSAADVNRLPHDPVSQKNNDCQFYVMTDSFVIGPNDDGSKKLMLFLSFRFFESTRLTYIDVADEQSISRNFCVTFNETKLLKLNLWKRKTLVFVRMLIKSTSSHFNGIDIIHMLIIQNPQINESRSVLCFHEFTATSSTLFPTLIEHFHTETNDTLLIYLLLLPICFDIIQKFNETKSN